MSYLHIPQASYPDGLTATAASGGEMTLGTYYFRVSCLTVDDDETCACAEVGITLDNEALAAAQLNWNAVPGISDYRVYMRKSTESLWTEGIRYKAEVATNSYKSTGDSRSYTQYENSWQTENTSYSVYGTRIFGQIFVTTSSHDLSYIHFSGKRVGSPGTLYVYVAPVHRVTVGGTLYWYAETPISTGSVSADAFSSSSFGTRWCELTQAWVSNDKTFAIFFIAPDGDADNYAMIESKSSSAYAYGYLTSTGSSITEGSLHTYTAGTSASFRIYSSTPRRFVTFKAQEHNLDESYIQPILPVAGSFYPRQQVQHMGKAIDLKRFDFLSNPNQALGELSCLRQIRNCGVPVEVVFYHGAQTWLDDYYFLKKFTWSLSPGTGIEWMHGTLDFVEG
uniref:Uncharacterized protein n=1 Tax=viral metagenome TaxID=1070528 RepID=A0A6M3IEB6_9ZZZZ